MPNNASKTYFNLIMTFKKSNIGPASVLYVPNTDNQIFRLKYRYKIGTL
jgi:hypothetical protein